MSFPVGMLQEIESILSRHHEWPDGLDSYDALFESGTFFPLQRRRELEAMMQVCRAIEPKTVMVIGADKGADVFHFVKCLPTVQKVIACEIRGTPYAELFSRYFPKVDFLFMPVGSRDKACLQEVAKVGNIDILFIDGDKNAFREDFEAYRRFMTPGGIALMHDVYLDFVNGGCQAAFRDVGKTYRTEKIIDLSEHDSDREKQQRGDPPKNSYGAWLRYYNDIPTCGVGIIYVDGSERQVMPNVQP